MEKGITKPSILIVADDFTGANDAGVSPRRWGIQLMWPLKCLIAVMPAYG